MKKTQKKEKRMWLYKEGEDAEIFVGEEAIEDAINDGWIDSPKGFKEVKPEENTGEGAVFLTACSDDELIAEAIERGLNKEVIPHDIGGDGKGDVNLNTLDRDALYEMAIKAELSVPHNIGKEKLIEKLLESEED